MVSKMQLVVRVLVVAGLAMTVSACGSSGSGGSTATTPPVVTATAQEDKFGTVFGTDFRATANSEPASVNDSDIVAVSLTTDPVAIN